MNVSNGSVPWRGLDHKQVLHPERGEPAKKVLHLRQHLPDMLTGLALDDSRGQLELAHRNHIPLFSHLTHALGQEHFQLHQHIKTMSI